MRHKDQRISELMRMQTKQSVDLRETEARFEKELAAKEQGFDDAHRGAAQERDKLKQVGNYFFLGQQ